MFRFVFRSALSCFVCTPLAFLGVLVSVLFLALWPSSSLAQETSPQSTVPSSPAQIFLPYVQQTGQQTDPLPVELPCEQTSDRIYETVLVDGPPTDRVPSRHGDLNLALRSYQPIQATLALTDINGPFDQFAPQFPGMFQDRRTATFLQAYQVNEWDWGCSADGCRGAAIESPPVTLVGVETAEGEAISLPSRSPEIMEGGFIALVLYAEENRMTLGYTRHDTVAPGYAVHMENICVDPNLLALYQQANELGRGQLPALKNDQILGVVPRGELRVAIRDRGSFMDPRSRKDWWQGR